MDAAVKFPTTPKAVKASPVKLSKRMSVEQAFQAIMRSCIDQIQVNEAGVIRFHDMESLHQMRVGLRRMRAALAIFDELVHAPDEIRAELGWIMDQLAPARDWDVLLAATLPQVEGALEEVGALAALRQATQEKISALHARAADAISSSRCQRLLARLGRWLDRRGWREDLSPMGRARAKMRVVDFAGSIVEAERARLLKRGRRLKSATAEERHRVRIAAKRTRYATEFFAALYPGKQTRPYVAAISALQHDLGAMNDATIGRRLLDELCEHDDGLRAQAALVHGYLAAGKAAGATRLRRAWKKFVALDAP